MRPLLRFGALIILAFAGLASAGAASMGSHDASGVFNSATILHHRFQNVNRDLARLASCTQPPTWGQNSDGSYTGVSINPNADGSAYNPLTIFYVGVFGANSLTVTFSDDQGHSASHSGGADAYAPFANGLGWSTFMGFQDVHYTVGSTVVFTFVATDECGTTSYTSTQVVPPLPPPATSSDTTTTTGATTGATSTSPATTDAPTTTSSSPSPTTSTPAQPPVATTPAPPSTQNPSAYVGHIVQWDADTKSQKTSWLVGSDLKRRWIPDAATYSCLKARGAPGPDVLPSSVLDLLPDITGTSAVCGRYFPNLSTTLSPFVAAGIDRGSLRAWDGSRSPPIGFTVTNSMPIAASYTIGGVDGATASVNKSDAYARIGVIGPGVTLHFTGQLPGPPPAAATVTFSIVDTKALVTNFLARIFGSADDVNSFVAATRSGAGAALMQLLRTNVVKIVTQPKWVKIQAVKDLSTGLIKFGVSRDGRKWLLDNLGGNLFKTIPKVVGWAVSAGQSAGAYFGLAHVGVGGVETVTFQSQQISLSATDH